MFPPSAEFLSYNMHLEVLWFPSMTFEYSNWDIQQFGPYLNNSQYSSKLKNLLIPFQCNKFSLLSLSVDCFVWEKLTGHTFSFLFLSIFIIGQSIIYQMLSYSNTKQRHKTSSRTFMLFIALSYTHCYCDISAVSLFMELSCCYHGPLAQSYAVSHWCPFCTIHFTKWIHYVLGEFQQCCISAMSNKAES